MCGEKFLEIFGRFGICLARMLHGAVGGVLAELPRHPETHKLKRFVPFS
jgi:hypothetical protein